MSRCVIDNLPEAKRQEIVNALLAGKALREVAKLAGVSHTAVDIYKRKKFLPTLALAQKVNASSEVEQSLERQVTNVATLTKAVISAAPIISRIQKHQETLDQAILDARQEKDARGVAALIRTDLSGLELDARLTGLLDSGTHVHVNQLAVIMSPKDEPEPAEAIETSCEPSE